MSSSSDIKRPVPGSCDDAIAEYLRMSESEEAFDRDEWLARYPKWADELREFITSHDQMESFAGEMRKRRNSAVAVSPFGTEIKYVGDYELLEQLGYGGMGIVFKARQASLDRLVALKMLLDDSRDRDRFRSEAEAAASLDHPNLVTIYEVGEHEGWPYYTMQFVDGRDLRSYMNEHALRPLATVALVAKLARAVQYAHDRGVLHRDLKPANVLVDKVGEPHITDFGLAKFVADASQITDTRTGTVMGTPSYMAPEQAAGDTTQITVVTVSHMVAASRREARLFQLTSAGAADEVRDAWQPAAEPSIVYVVMNGQGDRLAIQTNDDQVHLFSPESWPVPLFDEFSHTCQEPQIDRPRPIRPQFGNKNQLVLYDDPHLQTIDTVTGEQIDRFRIGFSRLLLVDVENERLLNGGDRRARFWNLDGSEPSSAYTHRGFVMDGDFSPDRQSVAIASWDRHVYESTSGAH